MNGKDVVLHVEVHLVHGLILRIRLEDDHAYGELVALIDALVDDKAVEQRKLRSGAHICRKNQAKVRKTVTLLALFVEVRLHGS